MSSTAVQAQVGKVYLVGAGPGAVDLITVRGQRLLLAADAVVHDALVEPDLYQGLSATLYDVGKRAGVHALPQDEISALLVELAKAGLQVVRLKGGDPFVLGRGSEEALALAQANVPYEVVPGVSSAIAAPLLAGIPVTHRGVADAFCVVSAHPREADLAFTLPAFRPRLTVVIMMGVGNVAAWSAALQQCGWPSDTPVAWVMWAGRPEQRRIDGFLVSAAQDAQAGGLVAPAVAVVGGVANLGRLSKGRLSTQTPRRCNT